MLPAHRETCLYVHCFLFQTVWCHKACALYIPDGVVSYSVRQGDRRGSELDFVDFTYDGMIQENFLLEGLGQLTDGEVGDYNFRLDNEELRIKGYEIVALQRLF
ncbi:hypothetical protein DPMN_048974 [Dreissena polymorpha]|uniref:Discoidin domain-containing protein n=1 Tax=Dreissena polymorpha TaxID=45954 RepID=A0A9D4I3E4_DREPO|nr:hypothetical protein DPMN_048974 [Dreissena polymorpha]